MLVCLVGNVSKVMEKRSRSNSDIRTATFPRTEKWLLLTSRMVRMKLEEDIKLPFTNDLQLL